MDKTKKLLGSFIIFTVSIIGCSYHAEYPVNWPETINSANSSCTEIVGKYKNLAERWAGDGSPERYRQLKLSTIVLSDVKDMTKINKIIINRALDGNYQIEARSEEKVLLSANKYLEKDYTCKDGWIAISEARMVAENIAGYEKTTYMMKKATDGSLIVKIRSSAVGFFLIIPVAGNSTEWLLFSPAN